jgi:hypothetical protein
MALVGFGGSRSLGSSWAGVVGRVVLAVSRAGRGVAVCSGAGASAFVRSACLSAVVFSPSFSGRGALPARASACVRACASAGPGSAWVAFVTGPCPAGVFPARTWRSGRPASGSWSEIALAVGLGLPVVVFWCAPGSAALPSWGGAWAPAGRGVWALGRRFAPPASVPLL